MPNIAPLASIAALINFLLLIGVIYFAVVVVKGITSLVQSNKNIEKQLNRLIDIQNKFLEEVKKDS